MRLPVAVTAGTTAGTPGVNSVEAAQLRDESRYSTTKAPGPVNGCPCESVTVPRMMADPATGSGIVPVGGPACTMIQFGSIHVPGPVVAATIVGGGSEPFAAAGTDGRTFASVMFGPLIVNVTPAVAGGRPVMIHKPVCVHVPGAGVVTFSPVGGDGHTAVNEAPPGVVAVTVTPPTPWPSPFTTYPNAPAFAPSAIAAAGANLFCRVTSWPITVPAATFTVTVAGSTPQIVPGAPVTQLVPFATTVRLAGPTGRPSPSFVNPKALPFATPIGSPGLSPFESAKQ